MVRLRFRDKAPEIFDFGAEFASADLRVDLNVFWSDHFVTDLKGINFVLNLKGWR